MTVTAGRRTDPSAPIPRARLRLGLPGSDAWWGALVWAIGITSLIYGYATSFVRLGTVQTESVEDSVARLGRVLIESIMFGFGSTGLILGARAILHGRLGGASLAVLGSYLLFLAARLVSCWLGTVPEFPRTLLSEGLLLVAVAVVPPPEPSVWRRQAERALCALFVWLTIVLIMVDWQVAVQRGYHEGYIPNVQHRLHGYLHANNLAALLFVYLLLLLLKRRQQGWGFADWINGGLALGLLFAAQSKTTAFMLLLVLGLHGAIAVLRAPPLGRLAASLAIVATLAAAAVFVTAETSVNAAIVRRLEERRQTFQTLTGRDRIWAITIEKWRENPWFGYGPGLWGPEMGQSYRSTLGWVVPLAHNQYLQSLGEAGVLGLAGLIAYLAALAGLALFPAARHGPVPAYLVAYMVLRGATEVAIGNRAYANGSLLVQILIAATVLSAAKARAAATVVPGPAETMRA